MLLESANFYMPNKQKTVGVNSDCRLQVMLTPQDNELINAIAAAEERSRSFVGGKLLALVMPEVRRSKAIPKRMPSADPLESLELGDNERRALIQAADEAGYPPMQYAGVIVGLFLNLDAAQRAEFLSGALPERREVGIKPNKRTGTR